VPNPDGTRTRDEIRRALIRRVYDYVFGGMDPDEALIRASLEVEHEIKIEWANKTHQIYRALGIKDQ